MTVALLVVLAYVIGATPTSHWVGRGVYGVDLRQEGSGNLGATNTYRILGPRAALPVVSVDILKGFLPTALFPALGGLIGSPWVLAIGGAAIAGHIFSFWVGFRGGKGVATSAGVFLALAPWAILVALVVWLAAIVVWRYVSLGSILAALVLPPAVFLTVDEGRALLTAFTAALSLFVIWAHRANMGRLLRGEENPIAPARRGHEGS